MRWKTLGIVVAGLVGLAGVMIATDSSLAGRPLTRFEAIRLADQTGADDLQIHSITGRGDDTEVRFIRAGDAIPLPPIEVHSCSPTRCLRDLSMQLWVREAQYAIADAMRGAFAECGLPPIAIPRIWLLFGDTLWSHRRPPPGTLDLEATLAMDATAIGADIDAFRRRTEMCVQTLVQSASENPGWQLLSDDVSIELELITLAEDQIRPSQPPVLEWGPYRGAAKSPVNGADLTYVQTVALNDGEPSSDRTRATADFSLQETIRAAAMPELVRWFADNAPGRALDDFVRMEPEMLVVGPSPTTMRILLQVTDAPTGEQAIVAVTYDIHTENASDIALVADFGDVINREGPSWSNLSDNAVP